MVQQQQAQLSNGNFVAGVGAASQTNGHPALESSSSSLAVPAIIATNSNPPPQAQYSPQASLYQQQLIKSAHQFAQQQQQQQQQHTRLNGINGTTSLNQQQQQQPQQYSASSQQNSPQQQANQFAPNSQEGFYGAAANGLQQAARPAPIYAPKPAYYGPIAQHSPHNNNNNNQGQMYQTTARQMPQQQQVAAGYFQQQQQHSPALGQAQPVISLAGPRQVHQGSMPMLPNATAAVSSAGPTQSAIEQQQRQMQHLVMSYQQQQQQQEQLQLQMQLHLQQQQQQQTSYLGQSQNQRPGQEAHRLAPILSRQLEPSLAGGNFWPVAEVQTQHLKSPLFSAQVEQQTTTSRPFHRSRAPISDRDSVSTLSRFNQLDDRRSFTMRSQYTTNALGKSGRQFGFVELAGEAMRQLLGFGSGGLATRASPRQTHQNEQLRQNLSLSVATAGSAMNGPEQVHKFGQQQLAGAKVTVIDSGDERQFGREVLSYRLAIMRLLNLLLSALVLLSPVAMLLLPKMEPLIRGAQEQAGSSLEYNAQEPSLAAPNVVTHAVGLASGQRQLAKAASVQPWPQWRISECQSDCDGPLIGFFVRLIMLAVAHWAIFFRPQTGSLPRVDFQRCLLISLALLITSAYWLFFVFRVFDKRFNDFELHYMTIVQFAISMLETLVLLHYLALVLIEFRHRKRVFCLKVVRSPDGDSKYYSCGLLSIQKCAQFVLEKYHRDFDQFGSYKEQLMVYEDELAHHLKRQRQAQQQNQDSANETTTGGRRGRSRSSRAGSPGRRNDDELDDETEDMGLGETGGRSASRRSRRRHHHRRHHSTTASRHSDEEDELEEAAEASGRTRDRRRSPSRSRRSRPADSNGSSDEQRRRKRTRGERSSDADDDERASSPGRRASQQKRAAELAGKTNNESADLSSDTTSRMKESSLETIRAANVGPSEQQPATSNNNQNNNNNKADIEISERPRHQQQTRTRDETESVRSARSRRSTGSRMHRSHRGEPRHQSARHPRERSSSRARAHVAIEVEPDDERPAASDAAELLEEHERKLRRRKLRLLAAVEDSFEQVRLLDEGAVKQATTDQAGRLSAATRQTSAGLDAGQAARTLYPSIARPLQKYLRLTKQTGRHNLQSIYEHLSKCLLYKLSARTFLEKFTKFDPVWQQDETSLFASCRLFGQMGPRNKQAERELQLNSWSLICDTLLSRQIDSGTFFLLKQGQVSLLVSVAKLPHWNLSEQVIDQNSCRFAYGPNPETSSV